MEIEKLYSPLEFYLHDPGAEERNGEYGIYDLHDERYKISHEEAWEYIDAIELAIRRDRDSMHKQEGMAEYLDEPLVSKVKAMFPSIEITGNGLFCATEITLIEPLTTKELEELKEWWSGQLSDGWGEGFEQRTIKVDGYELYVVPWTSDDSFFIETEREFNRRFAPDVSTQKNIEAEFFGSEGDAYALYLYEEKRDSNVFHKDNYRCFETGVFNAGDTLDTIRGNTGVLPSDVIVLKQDGEFMPWYVDLMAFSKLPEFYRSIEGIQIGTPITPAQAALFEPDALNDGKADEMRSQLVERLTENLGDYFATLHGMNGKELAGFASEISLMSEAHYYLTEMHNFHYSELDYLMQFKNPLQVVADEFESGGFIDRSDAMWKIFDRQEALQGDYELMPITGSIDEGKALEADTAEDILIEIRQQLNKRAEQNWKDYRNTPHVTTPDNLFNESVKVVSRRDAYMFIKDYEGFTAEQINCLLQFANPVDLVGDYLDPKSDISEMQGILENIQEEQENIKQHYELAADPSAPTLDELEQKLCDRLADNFEVYKRDMLDLSKEELFRSASEIAAVNEIYYYMTEEHNFTESEIKFLLNFQDPLEVLSDKSETQLHDVRETVLYIISEKDRILQSGEYELIPNEPDPVPDAPEVKRNVVETGEKPSVLERIKQHAQEQREHPSATKDKSGHKKSEPEL